MSLIKPSSERIMMLLWGASRATIVSGIQAMKCSRCFNIPIRAFGKWICCKAICPSGRGNFEFKLLFFFLTATAIVYDNHLLKVEQLQPLPRLGDAKQQSSNQTSHRTGSYMSTISLYVFPLMPAGGKKRVKDSRMWGVNNGWTTWPRTWQVCGIGRGNHSVHLEWALCFHLGQWCRRGNFQPPPDSLSARWKRLTSWK